MPIWTAAPSLLILAALAQAPAPAPTQGGGLVPRVEYYLVETRVGTPEGKPLGAIAGLLKRDYRPSAATITETSLAVDPAPGAFPTILVIEWTVTGSTATFKERSGRLTGAARFAGAAWNWTEWSSTATMRDVPGTFRNAAKLTRRGVSIHSERIDAAGKRLEVYDEAQTRISRETYELIRSKLVPQ